MYGTPWLQSWLRGGPISLGLYFCYWFQEQHSLSLCGSWQPPWEASPEATPKYRRGQNRKNHREVKPESYLNNTWGPPQDLHFSLTWNNKSTLLLKQWESNFANLSISPDNTGHLQYLCTKHILYILSFYLYKTTLLHVITQLLSPGKLPKVKTEQQFSSFFILLRTFFEVASFITIIS